VLRLRGREGRREPAERPRVLDTRSRNPTRIVPNVAGRGSILAVGGYFNEMFLLIVGMTALNKTDIKNDIRLMESRSIFVVWCRSCENDFL
jgi:hypothetical protein